MSHTALYKKISMRAPHSCSLHFYLGNQPHPATRNKPEVSLWAECGVPRGKSDSKEGCGRIKGRQYNKGLQRPFFILTKNFRAETLYETGRKITAAD
jgi:hypothetical protein